MSNHLITNKLKLIFSTVSIYLLSLCSCQSSSDFSCPKSPYSPQLVAYFLEVALNFPQTDTSRIVKWTQDIHIAVHGKASTYDLKNLRQLIAELNFLLPTINVCLKEPNPNVHLYFTTPKDFQKAEPYFKDADNPILNGVTFVYPNDNYQISKANILISSHVKDTEKRIHTIREELTQSLGLLTDSWQYPNSIFYEGQSYTTQFSDMDAKLIQLLYRSDIHAGINSKEVIDLLCNPVDGH